MDESDEMPFKKNNYLIPAFKLPPNHPKANYNDLEHEYNFPNLNSYEYQRKLAQYSPPTDFPRFYSSLDINSEGLFMLAANNFNTNHLDCVIAGTYDFTDFIESRFNNPPLKENLRNNCTKIKFLNDIKFFAAVSSDKLMMYKTRPCKQDFVLFRDCQATTAGSVTCFDRLFGINQLVVGTSKGHLEIFNYESNLDRDSQIKYAHMDEITGVSSSHTREKCWVTSSSDLSCVLWDNRKATPASFLIKNHRNRFTDVKWTSENLILASDSSGHVNLLDPRTPKVIMKRQKIADRSIDTLTFDANMKRFGVVSESPELKIYQIEGDDLKLVHEHSARPHILYAMAWDVKEENSFYVVGDKKYAKKVTW